MTTAALPVLKATRENTVKGEEMFLNDVKQVVTYMAASVNNVLKVSMAFSRPSAVFHVRRIKSISSNLGL